MAAKPGKKPERRESPIQDKRVFEIVGLDEIMPNPHQVRSNLEDAESKKKIESLAESIDKHGLQQPIVIRRLNKPVGDVMYQIVAGERRFRAHLLLERKEIPALIFDSSDDINDREAELVSLIENVQRENLDALDLANAIDRMNTKIDGEKFTLKEIGKILGMSEPAVSRIRKILEIDHKYLDDYKMGTFAETDDDGNTAIRAVRDAVSATALSEFYYVASKKGNSDEDVQALWEQVRCAKISTLQIREAIQQEALPESDKVSNSESEPRSKKANERDDPASDKLVKKSFATLDKAIKQFDNLPTLTASDRARLSGLIEKLTEMLTK